MLYKHDTIPESFSIYNEETELRLDLILKALKQTGGHRANAARLLGMQRTSLVECMRKYQIKYPARQATFKAASLSLEELEARAIKTLSLEGLPPKP